MHSTLKLYFQEYVLPYKIETFRLDLQWCLQSNHNGRYYSQDLRILEVWNKYDNDKWII